MPSIRITFPSATQAAIFKISVEGDPVLDECSVKIEKDLKTTTTSCDVVEMLQLAMRMAMEFQGRSLQVFEGTGMMGRTQMGSLGT